MYHLVNPTRPLYIFQGNESETVGPTNVDSQISILSSMQQVLYENQNSIQAHLQALTAAVQTVQQTLSMFVEQHELKVICP